MKTSKGVQTFKKTSAKQAELFPVLASKVGVQRPKVEFDLPVYETSDLELLTTAETFPVVLACLNNALSLFAKEQFAANPADWAFIPTLESLSLTALATSFERTTRGRILTLENAAKLGGWISRNVAAIVTGIQATEPTYTATQATAITGIVLSYTKYETKGPAFNEKVLQRLNQIMEAIAENEELLTDFMEDSLLAGVFEALLNKFSRDESEDISLDAL